MRILGAPALRRLWGSEYSQRTHRPMILGLGREQSFLHCVRILAHNFSCFGALAFFYATKLSHNGGKSLFSSVFWLSDAFWRLFSLHFYRFCVFKNFPFFVRFQICSLRSGRRVSLKITLACLKLDYKTLELLKNRG